MADESLSGEAIESLVAALESPRRRARQEAAHRLALVAREDVSLVMPHVQDLIDALEHPEAQTRWEIFDALGEVALADADAVVDACDGAEASLFDETSATVRLGAFRLLCRVGASSPERSDEVWPLLDEAIQCYHGNPEYHDMLLTLLEFAQGDLSADVREALIARVSFDAENAQGYMKGYSAQIITDAKGE
jgi:vesicle coat complex subunit